MSEKLESNTFRQETKPENEPQVIEPIDLASSTKQGRAINLIHNPATDVLINTTSKLADQWGHKLAAAWSDGRPVDWDISMSKYPHENLAVGAIDGKQFIAKKRLNRLRSEFRPEEIKTLHTITGQAAEQPELLLSQHSKAAWYSFESLLNEMHMAPAIREIIENPEVQGYVYNSGFDGIALVEPIIGVIDKNPNTDPDKFMVYEYIPDTQTLADLQEKGALPPGEADGLVDFLDRQFSQANIVATDLLPRQILVDNHSRLYLIDTEGYHKRHS